MKREADRSWVRRTRLVLRANPARLIGTVFLPGQESASSGESRASAILDRVLAMTEAEVDQSLGQLAVACGPRHRNLRALWSANFELLAHRLDAPDTLSTERRLVIGAYFTQEYAFEGVALFNPSMVEHPDQGGLGRGSTRFVMTARAVGEGHISSLTFRTGTIDAKDTIAFDPAAEFAELPAALPATYSNETFRNHLRDLAGGRTNSDFVLDGLSASFSRADLDASLANLREQRLTRGTALRTIDQLEYSAACAYSVGFDGESPMQERVLMPRSPSESHGIEDVRMVRFIHPDQSVSYLGTYTAFNGRDIASQLISTDDFSRFTVAPLSGPGSRNKGMALFPRQIDGRYVALSRADRESNGISVSTDLHHWDEPVTFQTPSRPWELVQLGNCGPPIETSAGWLVLTHGVGPMREYAIGAILLDCEDPSVVIGKLNYPLLVPSATERIGYVPNVVYSCGAMLHGGTLVLPYGCSDSYIRVALVELESLLAELMLGAGRVRKYSPALRLGTE